MYQLHKSDKSAFRAGTPTPKRNLSITNIAKIILQQNIFHLFLPTKYTKNQKKLNFLFFSHILIKYAFYYFK